MPISDIDETYFLRYLNIYIYYIHMNISILLNLKRLMWPKLDPIPKSLNRIGRPHHLIKKGFIFKHVP